ncbi:MAG: ABC transporter permease [Chloroflexota bacterium]|nr:ABC transporter permease [Chloroflexota bacterium]
MATTSLEPTTGSGVSVREFTEEEQYYVASQWQLMWRKFRRHRLGYASGVLLLLGYFFAITYDFWIPYDFTDRHDKLSSPPTRIHVIDANGTWQMPFVLGTQSVVDPQSFKRTFVEDPELVHPIGLFTQGAPYKFWGLFDWDRHFFGVEGTTIHLFGTDDLGRDVFSRTLSAARISLSIGLVGVILSFVLGVIIGGISGYFGGTVDLLIQRFIEFVISVPTIPLWMSLSAAVPITWSPLQTYFAITIVLSVVGWAGLARVVRGKILELRENDYVMAARVAGAGNMRVLFDHLVPGFMSYLIVHLTLQVPSMILAETTLSFLRLGIRAPAVSWGTLMQDAQNVSVIAVFPWLMIPGLFVIIAVFLFNFLGDGLRDAADPYR